MEADMRPDIAVVTGGEGYLASHLVKQLLERGYTVRATLLKDDEDSSKHLRLLAAALPGKLEIFEADCLVDGSFDQAANDAKYLFHLASPVLFGFGDPETNQRNIVDVAISGAKNAIRAAARSPSLQRVVLTSSIAAMHNSKDSAATDKISPPINGSLYTTQDWNTDTNVKTSPYPASKVQAEKAAWHLAKALGVDLVTILPAAICGPPIKAVHSYSTNQLKGHLEGASWSELLVEAHIDVRDVASAHIKAAETRTANGRYFISHETRTNVSKIADALKKEFPFLPIQADASTEEYQKYDNSKVQRELGLSDQSYIPLSQSFVDQARAMLALGMVTLPTSSQQKGAF